VADFNREEPMARIMAAGKGSDLAAARLIDLPSFTDGRGRLTAVEEGREIPFPIRRLYWISEVRGERGHHAHQEAELVQVAIAGSFTVELSDGLETRSFLLDRPDRGLHVPRLLWIRLHGASPDARVLILASTPFDEGKVIRSREEFLALRRELAPGGP
jgi:hypothetical protein